MPHLYAPTLSISILLLALAANSIPGNGRGFLRCPPRTVDLQIGFNYLCSLQRCPILRLEFYGWNNLIGILEIKALTDFCKVIFRRGGYLGFFGVGYG